MTDRERILILRSRGLTDAAIGRRIGLSRQRIHQIAGASGKRPGPEGLPESVRREVVALRFYGRSFREIAAECGISCGSVSNILSALDAGSPLELSMLQS